MSKPKDERKRPPAPPDRPPFRVWIQGAQHGERFSLVNRHLPPDPAEEEAYRRRQEARWPGPPSPDEQRVLDRPPADPQVLRYLEQAGRLLVREPELAPMPGTARNADARPNPGDLTDADEQA